MLTFRAYCLCEEIIHPSTSLGLERAEMPQIRSLHVPEFLQFLKSHHVTAHPERVPATTLRPTQKEINGDKVRAFRADLTGDKPMLVSKDNYILDGHHRWMQAVWNKETLNIIRLSINILPLIELAKKFPKAEFVGIHHFQKQVAA